MNRGRRTRLLLCVPLCLLVMCQLSSCGVPEETRRELIRGTRQVLQFTMEQANEVLHQVLMVLEEAEYRGSPFEKGVQPDRGDMPEH